MNIIFSYTPPNVKEPQWFKYYNLNEFVSTTQRDYSVRAVSNLDLIPEPKCFSLEFLMKYGGIIEKIGGDGVLKVNGFDILNK